MNVQKSPIINLNTVEDLNKLLSYQLGHACSKIIHRKVHYSHPKNLPAKLPGYGLEVHNAGCLTSFG